MEHDRDKGFRRSKYRQEENWRNSRSGNGERSNDGSTYFNNRERNTYRPRISNAGRAGSVRFTEQTESNRRGRSFEENNMGPVRKYGKSMGFMFLEDLLQKDPEDIHSTLLKERKGFLQLLETNLTSDTIVLVMKILKKVCSSSFSNTKYTILHSSFNDTFINNLRTFIACLPSQDGAQRRNNSHFWKDPNDFWTNLVEISEDILRTTPTFGCKSLLKVLTSMKIYIPTIEQEHDIHVADDIKKKVAQLIEIVQTLNKEYEEKQNSSNDQEPESVEPPDDFRQISVYPSPEEVVGGRGFLRENVVKGPYRSVDHYLDIQFRLLREDFVGPLREGITNYRSSTPSNHQDNVRVHKGVRFLNTETINENYCIRVHFGSKKKKLHNYENSKRFMYGSLVCFTKDSFKKLIFGKVAQRKVEDLQKGQLVVAFDEKFNVDYNSEYLMVECNVYFEPYFHVLTVLKNMNETNFPLERYIIRVNPVVQPPEYLTAPDVTYTVEGQKFDPLSDWPNENFYNLNESQLVAFKAAITQEIAIIQGPPGTGKTYLGLKIVQTLLKNVDCWYDRTPILIICFTNHALDQFLEGILKCTKNIIRVGGQSKNTKLDPYNLRYRTERDSSAVAQQRFEVQKCLKEIKKITEILEQIEFYNSVLAFSVFEEVVPDFYHTWFSKATNSRILHWLLEGAECEQYLNLEEHLNVVQVQAEFGNIDISDGQDNNDYPEFDDHVNTFDNIFDEICHSNINLRNGGFYMITLKSMRDQLTDFNDKLAELRQVETPTLQQLVREETLYLQLTELRQRYDYLKGQLTAGRQMGDAVEQPMGINIADPFKMAFRDRWNLYFYWLNLYKKHESDVLRMTCEDFPGVYKIYEEMRELEDVRAMKEALVVGMTTTSAARLRSSLQTLKNPIVVVEEAAEVLEAHIVTSITKHCKHLILIGDHKQLKPNTANYSMDKHYRLGISLFERMLINNIHCYTLNVQHRMRPEISCLIRPNIYDFLEDHPSVHRRPVITGIPNCLFFIDHDNPEESDDNSSKTNYHEVTFLIYLARHLVLNGYNSDNITILAAYLGQFFAFQREKKAHMDLLQGVRVAVLDNYQGEESDIILLSLVRNNKEQKIGFLKIENRVCVALSRARNGMYIMGNMAQLCHESELWRKIKTSFEQQNAVGKELLLRCQIHEDQITPVKCDTDFLAISEGGCSKKCDVLLSCGHKCASLCHVQNRRHILYKCQLQCNKKLCKSDETHLCKKMCYEDCGPCTYLVPRTLPCGHNVNIACHIDIEFYKCQTLVSTELPCGHTTDKPCYCDPITFRCPHICDVQVEKCGHACELLCHVRRDPDHLEYKCQKPCTKFQKNCTVKEDEHRCRKKCCQDCDECMITVRKPRTVCSHFYDVPCSFDVDELECEKPCTRLLKCGHNCRSKCNEECQECQMKVDKKNPVCGHLVKVKCGEPPDRKYCNKKCPLKLPCGHPCLAKCNEPCTSVCRFKVNCTGISAECGHIVTNIECHMTSSDVDPKLLIRYCNQPCRVELKCGHFCSGSCGECLQGRIHKRCTEKCGAVLVCDHVCDFPCRQACRPCKRVCTYRCVHSACSKTCGEVCTPCKEYCPRNCMHQRCRKFCGELCSVPPCTRPCQKLLKCGHPCIGFCGDLCPPKCLICHKDELLEVFFGTESEDSRFVFLNDCKHIVESTGMEQWLQQNQNEISYKLCPKCKTAIKTTQRYSDYIKMALMDVALVKIKANGNAQEIEERRNELGFKFRRVGSNCLILNRFCPKIGNLLTTMQRRIQVSRKGKRQPINIFELHSLKSKLQIIEHIVDICCNERVKIHNTQDLFLQQVIFVINALSRDPDYITDQEIDDIIFEINRLSRMVEFDCIQKTSQYAYYAANHEAAKRLITEIKKNLFMFKQFTKTDNDNLKKLLKELNTVMSSGIAISEAEKMEIIRAMGFSKGHWFKCPNGHVYAIGECGGAMQESKCNECGAKIGGRQHTLLGDNAVATEMDGALHGAWSEAVNLLNYNVDNLQ